MREIQLLDDPDELQAAEDALPGRFAASADFAGPINLATRSGQNTAQVYWHADAAVWACIDETGEPIARRFWNAFHRRL